MWHLHTSTPLWAAQSLLEQMKQGSMAVSLVRLESPAEAKEAHCWGLSFKSRADSL